MQAPGKIIKRQGEEKMRKSALEAAGKEFSTKGISKRVLGIMVSPIKEMRILAQEFDDVVSFGQGIPYIDTPDEIKKRLSEAVLHKDISKYTISPGLIELREKLAKKLEDIGISSNAKEILVTSGAMEAIFCAVMTIIEKGDEVIVFTPGFSSHIEQVILAGGTPVFSSLRKEDWGIDIDDLKSKVTEKTKAIIISNPNNPTGTVYSKEDLVKVAAVAKEKDLFIISDDPYNFLVYEGEYFSIASIPEIKEKVIACFSFSKEFAMTGYRLGYAVASEGIINNMMKVHDACCICAPAVSQQAGLIALDVGKNASDLVKAALTNNREIICMGLSKIKNISYVKPSGAYYVLVKYNKSEDSVSVALDILKKVHVEVVPGSAFGPEGEGHIRLSFGGKPDKLEEGTRRLKQYFDND